MRNEGSNLGAVQFVDGESRKGKSTLARLRDCECPIGIYIEGREARGSDGPGGLV